MLIFYKLTDFISKKEILDQILCQTICLTDFQTRQTEATLGRLVIVRRTGLISSTVYVNFN